MLFIGLLKPLFLLVRLLVPVYLDFENSPTFGDAIKSSVCRNNDFMGTFLIRVYYGLLFGFPDPVGAFYGPGLGMSFFRLC